MSRYLTYLLLMILTTHSIGQTDTSVPPIQVDSIVLHADTTADRTTVIVSQPDSTREDSAIYSVALPPDSSVTQPDTTNSVVMEEIPEPIIFDFDRQESSDRNARTYPWVFIMALVVTILIGVLRALDSTRYFYAIRTPFRSLKSEWGFFDLIPGIDLYQVIFVLIYCIIFSFALHIYQPFGLELDFQADWRNYLVLLLIVVVVYTVKYSVYLIVFQVLQTDKLPKMMVVSMSNLGFLFSIVAFPVLLVVYYSLSEVLRQYLGVGFAVLIILFFIYRFLRMLFLAWENFRFNRLYIILYLCTLEMLPLLLLANEVV